MTDGDAAGAVAGGTGEEMSTGAGEEVSAGTGEEDPSSRDIVVPMRLYKTVTVFSTLIAVVCVVFGFMLLDAATLNVSFLGNIVTGVLSLVGVAVGEGILSTFFAASGLGIIGLGAGVYVVGTRFRAEGMGKSQEDSDETSNDNG